MRSTTSDSKKIVNKGKAGTYPAFAAFLKFFGKKVIVALLVLIFWIFVWYAISRYVNKAILLPSPFATLKRMFHLMGDAEFWLICYSSILRIFLGTLAGCFIGILLAVLMAVSSVIRTILSPFLSAVRSVPVASFIIMALVWLDRGDVPSFIACLIVLPIICEAVYVGVKKTDRNFIEVAKIFRFSPLMKITKLYIPSALPFFLTALRTSVGMAWKSGVAAEVLCTAERSIGGELYFSKVYMESTDLFAWTVVIIILSMIFEKLTMLLVERGLKKYTVKEVADVEN